MDEVKISKTYSLKFSNAKHLADIASTHKRGASGILDDLIERLRKNA
jgi:hypothetical protein